MGACLLVGGEAHNIDDVCIESLSAPRLRTGARWRTGSDRLRHVRCWNANHRSWASLVEEKGLPGACVSFQDFM